MSIRCLVIGDPHFRTSTFLLMQRFIDETLQLVRTENPDIIVVLGDILDRHELMHQVPFGQAIMWLNSLASLAYTVVLIGNHDFKSASVYLPEEHPFVCYTGANTPCHPNLHIVHKPRVLVYERDETSFTMLCVPYVPPGLFETAVQEGLKDVLLSDVNIVFAHQEFRGARFGPNMSENGDPWDNGRPLVISGHIHDRQILQSNLMYVGTPLQIHFHESTDKAVSVFEFDPLVFANDYDDGNDDDNNELTPNVIEERRIRLNLPIRRKFTIAVANVDQWLTDNSGRDPENEELWLMVRGSTAEIRNLQRQNFGAKCQRTCRAVTKVTWDPVIEAPVEMRALFSAASSAYKTDSPGFEQMVFAQAADEDDKRLLNELFVNMLVCER
jgi:DNA repair exonuclease SbcCD nuclease subunit